MLDIAGDDCGDDDSGAPYEPAIACCEYGCECEGECGRPDGCGCEWDEYEEVCACECERGAACAADEPWAWCASTWYAPYWDMDTDERRSEEVGRCEYGCIGSPAPAPPPVPSWYCAAMACACVDMLSYEDGTEGEEWLEWRREDGCVPYEEE